jgi:glutamine synthetase
LGWLNVDGMTRDANPQETAEAPELMNKQTVEFRCPDGSADIYLLLAGLTVAARYGLEMDNALEVANSLYVSENIFAPDQVEIQKRLPHLPASCCQSAECLLNDREVYEKGGVFPQSIIDETAKKLKSYSDDGLNGKLQGDKRGFSELIGQYLHC